MPREQRSAEAQSYHRWYQEAVMARLTNLKPVITSLRPAIAYSDSATKSGRIMAPPAWKRWYHTARWKRLRIEVFARDMFTCQMCGRLQGNTSKLVADHRRPHRGNAQLFWDMNNLQTLCDSPCHSSAKQRDEASAPGGMWD